MGESKMFSNGRTVLLAVVILVTGFVLSGSANADGLSHMTREPDSSARSHRLPHRNSSLVWQTSKEDAVSLAKAQGKKILLVAERSTATYTRNTLCETNSPKIKCLIEQNFIPWFHDIDSGTDHYAYSSGLETFYLPLICCIDPDDSDNYLDRSTGSQTPDEFYSRLQNIAGADCLTVNISGYVRDSQESGIPDVMLSFSGGLARTDSSGHYEYDVISGWSGTVKPYKIGYTFSPEILSYSNCASAQNSQDYIADLSDPDADYIFEIYHTGRVAELLMPSQEFEDWNNGAFSDDTKRRKISKFLYTRFKDDFDFIFLISNNEELPDGLDYHGRCITVRNDVEGIGYSLYDYTEPGGSSGSLRSIIHMPYRTGLDNGPSLHELLHTWANSIVETSMQSHWGFSSGGGQLGGFAPDTLIHLGNGVYQANNGKANSSGFGEFANGGNSIPYSDIELYLMGMIDKSQVQPLQVAVNPEWVEYGKFSADSFLTYTMDDIIQEHGERTPSSEDSQKRFKGLAVAMTPTPLTEQEWAEVDEDVEWFSREGDDSSDSFYNFWEATRGIAAIEMDRLSDSLIAVTTLSPVISVSRESLSFGKIMVGSSESETLTIGNSGNVSLEIGMLSITGTDTSGFEIENDACSGLTIAPSETCTFDVKGSPASEGEKNALLEIPSDDPDTLTVPLVMVGISDLTSLGLRGVVLALQVCAGISGTGVTFDAGVSGDGKIGLEEAIYILQDVAGLRD
ncbi:choice-of-anchor D domain-containing protein [Desulfococcaceae bacterium HSG8]|nr:choice-of-anchor D domain-containing protein [Desulfococcaceae bacterium HSG8]